MHRFWQTGYASNSVKSLAEYLGITRSSFYNAFGSQEDLFKEALRRYFRTSPDQILMKPDLGSRSVRQLITDLFRDICRIRAADPERRGCMAVNAVTELCAQHPDLGPLMADTILGTLDRIRAVLEVGVETGELPQDLDINARAMAVQSLMIGINTLAKVVHREDELWSACRETLAGLDLLSGEDAA